MDMEMVTNFFMWCTIINGDLLVLSFLMCVLAQDWIYNMHSKFFAMPRETFNVVLYSLIGLYKIFFFVFNLVPYAALLLINR